MCVYELSLGNFSNLTINRVSLHQLWWWTECGPNYRHWETCSSNPGVRGICSFGPFVFHIFSSKLVSSAPHEYFLAIVDCLWVLSVVNIPKTGFLPNFLWYCIACSLFTTLIERKFSELKCSNFFTDYLLRAGAYRGGFPRVSGNPGFGLPSVWKYKINIL